MENHRQKGSSGDKFSFPMVPVDDHQGFEFGCVIPGSPNSPADHLFFNGRLLPHDFPSQPTNSLSFSRSTSRTSSKESFMSSRSNSINTSRSSSCSSARTSTSEATSDHRKVSSTKTSVSRDHHHCYQAKKPAVLTPHYSSSQRWQFITPAPALKHQRSRTRKTQGFERQESKSKKKTRDWTNANPWFGWRFFKSFVSACKECHAIKPSSTKYLAKI